MVSANRCACSLLLVGVVWWSGSVALLADTIHNFGDAATAIPLGIAFWLARRQPNTRFTYGYGRVEDLAGVMIVGIILISALVTGYESIDRLLHPRAIDHLSAVAIAALIGFLGNEIVARFRIRVGQEINSAALVADGYHARTDSLTSLAVLLSAIGTGLGYLMVDSIVGLVITAAIFKIVIESALAVFHRLLDGVEPEILDQIHHAVEHVEGVKLQQVRARWLGHHLQAELLVGIEANLSIAEGSALVQAVKHKLRHHLPYLSGILIEVGDRPV
jgi:cation diffusion facilitator family transporter